MSNPSFPEQLHELWRTRPVRLPRQGPIAGVAAGIGYRYSVDPVLIRVAFAVSTIFGGIGIVLYLACWLLLPQAGDKTSAAESLVGRGRSSESGTKTVVLAVALIIALSTLGPVGVGLGGSGLISLALMLGGLWLLHQRRPVPPPPAAAYPGVHYPPTMTGYPGTAFPPVSYPAPFTAGGYAAPGAYTTLPKTYEPSAPFAAAPEQVTSDQGPSNTSAHTGGPSAGSMSGSPADPILSGSQPPSWDPLGVAPFAWDLPEPTPAPPPVPPAGPTSRLTKTVLGLAILAAAGTWLLSSATGADWLSPARIGAVALAVIGIGLLVGAFLRRGYGVLVVTGPLTGFVLLASLIGPVDLSNGKIGPQDWKPATADEVQSEYAGTLGEFTLDLRQVALTADKTVDIRNNLGSFTVLVPPNLDVRTHCSMNLAECPADELTGGDNGIDGGPVLTLNLTGNAGEVMVHRG